MKLKHLVWVALLTAACDASLSDPLRDVEVRTAASKYRTQELISVEIANPTTYDAFFYHCNHRISYVVEQNRNGSWIEFASMTGPACLGIYEAGVAVVTPGDMRIESLQMPTLGRYRLKFPTGTRSASIGSHLALSNEFVVE